MVVGPPPGTFGAPSPPGAPSRVERFFDALLTRDGAGGSWLASMLEATPRGGARLGELVGAPGWLEATIAVRTETGRRGAFEYPASPSPRLLAWFIDHPDELHWPDGDVATAESVRLRRALVRDDPPGARPRAQDRARQLLAAGGPLGPAWWRFEEAHRSDCVLVTDRLLVLVRDGDREGPATPWLPRRADRVRDLEAAQRFGETGLGGPRTWAVLTLQRAVGDGGASLAEIVEAGAPHLSEAERAALVDGDLGELDWESAAAATGLDLAAVPGF